MAPRMADVQQFQKTLTRIADMQNVACKLCNTVFRKKAVQIDERQPLS
jgi:hypothetical protein